MDMDSDLLHEFLFFNVFKDGRVDVFSPATVIVPPQDNPITGVKIKDIHISSHVSARVFLPPTSTNDEKLPVVLYVHGGGFCLHTVSAFMAEYTAFLSSLAADANIIAVSIDYGLFPSRPIPACYDDSWEALCWIVSHASGSGPEPWLNHHGDLERIFIAGDSAGGNICHTLAVKVGSSDVVSALEGMIMIHPYFGEDDKMWMYMCPTNEGPRDRRMKAAEEDMVRLGCGRVLVFVAEKDSLRDAGTGYTEELGRSGWNGVVELVENKDRDHCFHIAANNGNDIEAIANLSRMVSFIKSK